MRILLDTHVLLWFLLTPEKLSIAALSAIQHAENQVYVSLASAWEMSIKSSLGKLSLTQPIEPFILDQARRNRFDILPITLAHIAAVERMPHHHRDPFDRLLIAQSLVENIPLVSADSIIHAYPITHIWRCLASHSQRLTLPAPLARRRPAPRRRGRPAGRLAGACARRPA